MSPRDDLIIAKYGVGDGFGHVSVRPGGSCGDGRHEAGHHDEDTASLNTHKIRNWRK